MLQKNKARGPTSQDSHTGFMEETGLQLGVEGEAQTDKGVARYAGPQQGGNSQSS